jgi:hypothetical protein
MSTDSVPFDRSYWVEPGKLLAGCYPGGLDPQEAERKLAGLVDHGIRTVINLMEEDETNYSGRRFRPYADILQEKAREADRDTSCVRIPITDMGVPSEVTMITILDTIDSSLARGHSVFIHCWGGHGRTGTVVGCWLARHEKAVGGAALGMIKQLRKHSPDAAKPSPQTPAQEKMVAGWRAGS